MFKRGYEIEALMFDAPMVDYKAATDPECTLIAAGSNFWSDTYGLALARGSSLTAKISSLIVKYEATGILTSWEKKWLNNKSECHSAFMSSYRLSFKHAGGVFVLIGIGVVAALGVLVLEWIIYKFLVPILRKHKRHGRWRYIMFISQVSRQLLFKYKLHMMFNNSMITNGIQVAQLLKRSANAIEVRGSNRGVHKSFQIFPIGNSQSLKFRSNSQPILIGFLCSVSTAPCRARHQLGNRTEEIPTRTRS